MGSIVGEGSGWTFWERDEAVCQNVGGSFSCTFRGGDSEYVRPATEAVREEEDLRTSAGHGRQGPKVVNANGITRAVGQVGGWYWTANCLASGLVCLTIETASHLPFCAHFHTEPPKEEFQYFEGARDTEMIEGIGMAYVHDPRSGQKRYIDAGEAIKGTSARIARVAISRWGYDNRFSDEQDSVVVSLTQEV